MSHRSPSHSGKVLHGKKRPSVMPLLADQDLPDQQDDQAFVEPAWLPDPVDEFDVDDDDVRALRGVGPAFDDS